MGKNIVGYWLIWLIVLSGLAKTCWWRDGGLIEWSILKLKQYSADRPKVIEVRECADGVSWTDHHKTSEQPA